MNGTNYKQVVIWDASIIDVSFLGSEQSVPLALRGLANAATKITTGAPAATAGQWIPGSVVYNAVDATMYLMTGTTASPVWSLVESSGVLPNSTIAYNSDATAGPLTIPAAKMVDAILDRNGGTTNRSDTTDTATAIVAAISGAIVGTAFYFYYRNSSATPGQLLTLGAGAGVTISGNVLVASGQTQVYIGRITNVGTPAVTLYAVNNLAGALVEVITGSTVNTLRVTTAATGSGPSIAPVGSDTNIPSTFAAKGTGAVILGQATSVGVELAADQPIVDSSLNAYIAFTKTASAVNHLNITNAETTTAPILGASGSDTDIGIKITPKGAGVTSSASPVHLATTINLITAGGSNNAITAALLDANGVAIPTVAGLKLTLILGALTLQAGANTLNLNGTSAIAIKSHNAATVDIAAAYAANGIIEVIFNGTSWLDMSQ